MDGNCNASEIKKTSSICTIVTEDFCSYHKTPCGQEDTGNLQKAVRSVVTWQFKTQTRHDRQKKRLEPQFCREQNINPKM